MDELPPLTEPYFTHPFGRELWHDEQMRAYAAAAVAAEREQCAKLCDPSNSDRPDDWTEYAKVRAECAAAIRSR